MDNSNIPESEVEGLLASIKANMATMGFDKGTVGNSKIIIIHPDTWEISLLVPYEGLKASETRKRIETILFKKCGVARDCCDYLGKRPARKAYEWYFRHPNTPEDICEKLELILEEKLGEKSDFGNLPCPRGNRSKTDTVFLSLASVYFDTIARGEKTIEYRMLNQYYCDKLFSPGVSKRFVKFNRGYEPNQQMVFELVDILYVDGKGNTSPSRDAKGKLIVDFKRLPKRFIPSMYGLVLGKRVS